MSHVAVADAFGKVGDEVVGVGVGGYGAGGEGECGGGVEEGGLGDHGGWVGRVVVLMVSWVS